MHFINVHDDDGDEEEEEEEDENKLEKFNHSQTNWFYILMQKIHNIYKTKQMKQNIEAVSDGFST